MPGRIDAGRQQRVVLHVDFAHLTVVGNDRAAMVQTGVELHALRVVLLVVMAVHTLARHILAAEHVVDDDSLVVVLQAALVDGQFLETDVRRCDEAIANPGVYAVGRDGDGERLVARPLVGMARKDLHLDALAARSGHQLAPLVGIGLYRCASTDILLAVKAVACYHLVGVTLHLEGQWSDVHRHCYVGIVRIDGGQLAGCRIVVGHTGTTGCGQQQCA